MKAPHDKEQPVVNTTKKRYLYLLWSLLWYLKQVTFFFFFKFITKKQNVSTLDIIYTRGTCTFYLFKVETYTHIHIIYLLNLYFYFIHTYINIQVYRYLRVLREQFCLDSSIFYCLVVHVPLFFKVCP